MNARKLGRSSAPRVAMYRNLVSSLLEHEQVETTHAKARELKRLADQMITLGKRGDLHARRQAMRVVHGKDVAAKLFGELAERYASRPGGYTRVLRTRTRVGDAAEMSIVQLVEPLEPPAEKKKASSGKKKTAKKASAKNASAKKAPAKKARKKKTAQADAD
jgi:large subunit ribosomal protein L17